MNQTALYLDRAACRCRGFLGQPLVEKIRTSPTVGRIHVPDPQRQSAGVVLDAQRRLGKALPDRRLRPPTRVHGDAYLAFMREKLVAVAERISQEGLGIDPESPRLQAKSMSSSTAPCRSSPLDEALRLNVEGARRVAQFAAGCRKAVLVHVSTAYVSGASHEVGTETLYHTAPAGTTATFPRGHFAGVDADLERIRAIIASCQAEATQPEVEREFTRVLVERSRNARAARTSGRRKVIDSLRKKWLETRLTEAGDEWRRFAAGTPAYTKALGEQIVARPRRQPLVIMSVGDRTVSRNRRPAGSTACA
jgi:hypothetical protein